MTDLSYLVHSGLTQSLIYNLSTGDPWIDFFISTIATMIISYVIYNYRTLLRKIKKLGQPILNKFGSYQYRRRFVAKSDYDKANGEWGEDTSLTDCPNLPLINAIFYYLHKNNFHLETNNVVLMVKDSNTEIEAEDDYDLFKNRNIVYLPEEDVTCKLDNMLSIKYSVMENREKEYHNKEFEMVLSSPNLEYIDNLVEKCWTTYLEDCHKKKDPRKFFYTINRIDTQKNKIYCTQYELKNKKTLDRVFIPEIGQIKELVDNFMNKEGPFKMKIFPYKLGWIFHGIPGSGKTSIAKALASYTNRHIVYVSFPNINTNAEMFQLFNNPVIVADGKTHRYKIDDIIYVADDLDAIDKKTLSRMNDGIHSAPPAAAISQQIYDDSDSDDSEFIIKPKKAPKRAKQEQATTDKLNLQGILNVLDGTLDSPGRILIMTTNHIERLDPALKRPGRVNQVIEFSLMTRKCMRDFLEDTFKYSLTDDEYQALPDKQLSPAKVEEICIENYNSVKDAIYALIHHDGDNVENTDHSDIDVWDTKLKFDVKMA